MTHRILALSAFALVLLTVNNLRVAAAAQDSPGTKESSATGSVNSNVLPAGYIHRTICNNLIEPPGVIPPPDATFLWVVEICFSRGEGSFVLPTTYLTDVKLRASIPSRGNWVRWDEAVERQIRLDLETLKLKKELVVDVRAEVEQYRFDNGASGRIVSYVVSQREPISTGKSTGSAPLTFEVASIKRTAPGTPADAMTIVDMPSPDRWSAINAPLSLIVGMLYKVRREQIVDAPSWFDTMPFDINAKASREVPRAQIDEMAKQLLAERFKLAVRTEQRPIELHALVLARSDGKLGPGLRPVSVDCDAASARSRVVDPKSVTPSRPACGVSSRVVDGVTHVRMGGQFIQNILVLTGARRIAGGGPVVDRTGLEGRFDVDLDYVSQQAATADVGSASGPSLESAFREQLGLKFERRRELVDVLVIERVEMPSSD